MVGTSRKNFPSWKKIRREVALENLQKKLSLSDKELYAKYHIKKDNIGEDRKRVSKEAEILKERIEKAF